MTDLFGCDVDDDDNNEIANPIPARLEPNEIHALQPDTDLSCASPGEQPHPSPAPAAVPPVETHQIVTRKGPVMTRRLTKQLANTAAGAMNQAAAANHLSLLSLPMTSQLSLLTQHYSLIWPTRYQRRGKGCSIRTGAEHVGGEAIHACGLLKGRTTWSKHNRLPCRVQAQGRRYNQGLHCSLGPP